VQQYQDRQEVVGRKQEPPTHCAIRLSNAVACHWILRLQILAVIGAYLFICDLETVPLTRGCYRFFPFHILVHSANSEPPAAQQRSVVPSQEDNLKLKSTWVCCTPSTSSPGSRRVHQLLHSLLQPKWIPSPTSAPTPTPPPSTSSTTSSSIAERLLTQSLHALADDSYRPNVSYPSAILLASQTIHFAAMAENWAQSFAALLSRIHADPTCNPFPA
jgi:hypothetical protein